MWFGPDPSPPATASSHQVTTGCSIEPSGLRQKWNPRSSWHKGRWREFVFYLTKSQAVTVSDMMCGGMLVWMLILNPLQILTGETFLASTFQRLAAGTLGRRRSLPSHWSVILRSQDKLMHQRLKGVTLCRRWSRTEVQFDALIKTQTVKRQSQRLSGCTHSTSLLAPTSLWFWESSFSKNLVKFSHATRNYLWPFSSWPISSSIAALQSLAVLSTIHDEKLWVTFIWSETIRKKKRKTLISVWSNKEGKKWSKV